MNKREDFIQAAKLSPELVSIESNKFSTDAVFRVTHLSKLKAEDWVNIVKIDTANGVVNITVRWYDDMPIDCDGTQPFLYINMTN